MVAGVEMGWVVLGRGEDALGIASCGSDVSLEVTASSLLVWILSGRLG